MFTREIMFLLVLFLLFLLFSDRILLPSFFKRLFAPSRAAKIVKTDNFFQRQTRIHNSSI